MATANAAKQRLLVPATIVRQWASRVKPATGRRFDRTGNITAQNDAVSFDLRVGYGNR